MVNALDLSFNAFTSSIQSPVLTKIMIAITSAGDIATIFPLSVILIAFLIYLKKFQHGVIASLSLIIGLSSSEVLKRVIGRSRPSDALMFLRDHSFPSGHAIISTIFFCLLYYIYQDNIKDKLYKKLFLAFCIAMPILISFSRLYLNVHWLTDVIAGMLIGIFWAALFIKIDKQVAQR